VIASVLSALACPHCQAALVEVPGALRCANGHAFDVARSGYVNLLAAQANASTHDTAEMVAARHRFLGSGVFEPIASALVGVAIDAAAEVRDEPAVVVEVGAGTGYYLAHVLDALPKAVGLALDVSKYAARRAARSHPRVGAAVCDVWSGLPIAEGSVALVLDVFAPRNAAEAARVLRPNGRLIVVTPTPAHLAELVAPLGLLSVDAAKEQRTAVKLASCFERLRTERVEAVCELSLAQVLDVVMMGPSSRHLDADDVRLKAGGLGEPVPATLSVDVASYALRDAPDDGSAAQGA